MATGLDRHVWKSSETSVVSQKLSKCKQTAVWLLVDVDARQVSSQLAKSIQMQREVHYGASCECYD